MIIVNPVCFFRLILTLLTTRLFTKRLYDPLPTNKLYNFLSRVQDKEQMVAILCTPATDSIRDDTFIFREIMRSCVLIEVLHPERKTLFYISNPVIYVLTI